MAAARQTGIAEEIDTVRQSIDLSQADIAFAVDLLLAYREVKAYDRMLRVVVEMPEMLKRTVLVREQQAVAQNRLNRAREAEAILKELIREHGANSETNAILGRVYKDLYYRARTANNLAVARTFLKDAIEAYLEGFEVDWRDAYPGVNAVTLMELCEPVDPRQADLIPIVSYSVKRRILSGDTDYWDYASLIELAVLAGNKGDAEDALKMAQATRPRAWQCETTARNLRLLTTSSAFQGDEHVWICEIAKELERCARLRA